MIPRSCLFCIALLSLITFTHGADTPTPATIKSLTIIADAVKPFGDITVSATATGKDRNLVLETLTISYGTTQISVPKEALAGIKIPELASLAVTGMIGEKGEKDGSMVSIHYARGTRKDDSCY